MTVELSTLKIGKTSCCKPEKIVKKYSKLPGIGRFVKKCPFQKDIYFFKFKSKVSETTSG